VKKTLLLRSVFRQLGANLLTTFFMCAGIMIGIAVLIAVIALGQGTEARILERVDRVGIADTFTLRTVPWGQGGGGLRDEHGGFLLKFDDVLDLQNQLPGIAAVTPTLNTRSSVGANSEALDNISIQGAALGFQDVRDWNVQAGSLLSDEDIELNSPVAVLGPALAAWFFRGDNPIGNAIYIEDTQLEVIGVLESRGASGSGRNADEIVLVPEKVFAELFQPLGLSTVTVRVEDASRIETLARDTREYLEGLYPGEELFVRFPMATARARDEMANALSFYLTGVAILALLIGGTVMMNLTSLSVSARTREIGLRKALGARKRDISRQVLLETVMISLIAGIAGMVLGYVLTNVLAARLELRSLMTWHAPVAGLALSMVAGCVFGVRPAKRAASLDPVVALRGISQR